VLGIRLALKSGLFEKSCDVFEFGVALAVLKQRVAQRSERAREANNGRRSG
jgi:hypothetical protein